MPQTPHIWKQPMQQLLLKYLQSLSYATLTPQGWEIDGDLNISRLGLLELPDFKSVNGYLDIRYNNLVSLDGCPEEVKGWFNCSNNKLKDLVGGPRVVGTNYICSYNDLESLKGGPEKIGRKGTFDCSYNELDSLIGNKLKDVPYITFICVYGILNSLKGSPEKVGTFNCSDNDLDSLEYGPQYVTYDFFCKHNQLINLIGAPSYVGDILSALNNPLKSLAGAPTNKGVKIFHDPIANLNKPGKDKKNFSSKVAGLFIEIEDYIDQAIEYAKQQGWKQEAKDRQYLYDIVENDWWKITNQELDRIEKLPIDISDQIDKIPDDWVKYRPSINKALDGNLKELKDKFLDFYNFLHRLGKTGPAGYRRDPSNPLDLLASSRKLAKLLVDLANTGRIASVKTLLKNL